MRHKIRAPEVGEGEDEFEVASVKVEEGDLVEEGDVLVVLLCGEEGQNEVTAPVSGRVVDVKVEEGDSVAAGDILLLLKEVAEGGEDEDPSEG
ncbi:MAG: biotin/lipoyl-binding protein [Planctomycetes bacterium]|nr:biotin/lipoyl-binding protein [Planctomycetota bacterium]